VKELVGLCHVGSFFFFFFFSLLVCWNRLGESWLVRCGQHTCRVDTRIDELPLGSFCGIGCWIGVEAAAPAPATAVEGGAGGGRLSATDEVDVELFKAFSAASRAATMVSSSSKSSSIFVSFSPPLPPLLTDLERRRRITVRYYSCLYELFKHQVSRFLLSLCCENSLKREPGWKQCV